MDNRRSKIIREFAKWVAMSSARQGSEVRGRKLYPYIEDVDLNNLIGARDPSEPFADWHRREVEGIAKRAKVSIGWAAKIINMLTKVWVYIAFDGNPSLRAEIHPPIDNQLIEAIKRKYPARRYPQLQDLYDLAKPIVGIKEYADYCRVIEGLRRVAKLERCTLFEVEALWKPENK